MKNRMRYLMVTLGTVAVSMLWSCSSTMYSAGSPARFTDDLYATHDKQAIAKQVAAERQQARIAAQAARDAEEQYEREQSGNPYQDILADDYESAYKRRLKGFESPTYKMPSSYYNFRYGDDASYASAYDPSFYNVMVMGDQVWVEPKYVTSMFGTWGRPVNVNFNMGFGGFGSWGWGGYPNYGWGYPNYGWGSPYYGWNSPYYGWGGGWNYPYYGWGGGWGYPHHGWGGHYPTWGGGNYYDKNTTYRPSYSNYSGNGSSGYRSPSKYSSGSNNSGTTKRPSSTTPSYRNRYDKDNSGSTTNRYEPSTSRPTYTPPSTPSYGGGSSSGGSSSGGSYGGSSGRSGGLGGR